MNIIAGIVVGFFTIWLSRIVRPEGPSDLNRNLTPDELREGGVL